MKEGDDGHEKSYGNPIGASKHKKARSLQRFVLISLLKHDRNVFVLIARSAERYADFESDLLFRSISLF